MSCKPGIYENDYEKWGSERLVQRLESLRLQANTRLRRHRERRKAALLKAQHLGVSADQAAPAPKGTHKSGS
jgi:hypothetical protein